MSKTLESPPSFNPRTHEGCDIDNCSSSSPIRRFNPRTHEGCDSARCLRDDAICCFNPRTHEGCDSMVPYLISSLVMFQSTHPRGVRQVLNMSTAQALCFNPRTHEGCDFATKVHFATIPSFNPRTHEGCDRVFSKRLNITMQK